MAIRKLLSLGTGTPIREFLFVDDLAEACVYLMNTYEDSKIVNIGTGVGVTSIRELAESIAKVVGYKGQIVFDTTKPDGTPVKINDVSYLKSSRLAGKGRFVDGDEKTYAWYMASQEIK